VEKRLIYGLIFGLGIAICNAQTNYYVSTIGNDANNGTSIQTPWKTIQKACNSATANSTVLIRGGVYNENVFVNVSGTVGGPITFSGYLNEQAVIDGSGATASTLLRITGRSHLVFNNLTIENLSGNSAKGILIENSTTAACTDLVFKNITIRNINWTDDAAAIPTAANNAHAFIAYGGNPGITNLVVDGCNIHDNILGYSEALTLSGNVSGFSITNSEIHDNTNIGIGLAGNYGACDNPLFDKARFGVVSGNTCYRNISPVSVSAGIYVDGGEDILIEKNISYQNGIGIEVGCERNGTAKYIMVRDNFLYNNRLSGLSVGGYNSLTTGQVLWSTFRNNTLFQDNVLNSGSGEITLTKLSNCVFEDNLICTNEQNVLIVAENIAPQANNLTNYNCWLTPTGNLNNIIIHWGIATYSSFVEYKNATLQDLNSIYGGPALPYPEQPAPYMLLTASNYCVNAGNPFLVVADGETDIQGNPRINNGVVDIGASEFYPSLGTAHTGTAPASSVAPNPFNEGTTIHIAASLTDGTLQVYDLQGKLLSETNHISGKAVPFSRGDLRSGLYLYRITEHSRVVASGKLSAN
jgi:hypothetical protein